MSKVLIITNLCYGILKPTSVVFCEEAYKVIENIINISNNYDICYIINDAHYPDDIEFKNFPPHLIDKTEDVVRLYTIETKLKTPLIQTLRKRKQNIFATNHIKYTIVGSMGNTEIEELCITGFTGCIDIIPSVLGAREHNIEPTLYADCIGDLSHKHKELTLDYLRLINCKIK
jgi:hypothetical protein